MRLLILPAGTRPEAGVLLAARSLRAFADGLVSLVLPAYLTALGYGPVETGILATATLLGSAVLTLLVGVTAHRVASRALLLAASALMVATGLAFASFEHFWPLLLVAVVGTLNPSSGDVSVFLPLEQAQLAQAVPERERTALFARYSLLASLFAAVGALAAGLPGEIGRSWGLEDAAVLRAVFVLYAVIGVTAGLLYRRLPRGPAAGQAVATPKPLGRSRRTVLTLAALFSLDSFGGGFVVQSMLALWLFQRFGLSLEAAAGIFFATGLLSAVSQLLAAPLARRIGLVNTMVFTHLPANLCLVLVPFMPGLVPALVLLLVRSALSQMDVPPRTAYVMAVVDPSERAAAAAVTAVPRSLASALSPALAGWMLAASTFGWPLVFAGALKITYDLLLLHLFGKVGPRTPRA